jgi:dihydrofolate reductase
VAVGKVVFDISMSLDGFMTAANRRPEEPLGDGGERLHEWAFGDDERDREVLSGGVKALGAVVAGRRTYDDSVPWWGADGPTGETRVPVYVLTHDAPKTRPREASTPSSPVGSKPPWSRPGPPPGTRT